MLSPLENMFGHCSGMYADWEHYRKLQNYRKIRSPDLHSLMFTYFIVAEIMDAEHRGVYLD